MDSNRVIVFLLSASLLSASLVLGGDWPRYRGPTADGTTPEAIRLSWPSNGPKVLWKTPLGKSFGSFAVAGNKACIYQERPPGQESCTAYNAASGHELWSTVVDKTIHENEGGDGPRSTPTMDGDHVYVLSTFLKVQCLAGSNGKMLWSHDLAAEFGGKQLHWGNAASPVVEGNLVIVAGGGAGQSLLAFDKMSGKLAWKCENQQITHATPVPATIGGVRQMIFFLQSGLVAVNPESGDVLWKQSFPYNVSTAASPVVAGDIVYCSAGYGVGGGAYKIEKHGDAFASRQLWRTPGGNVNHWTTSIYHDGCLYGLFGFKQFKTEPLKCIDLETGKEKWSQDGFGQGGLVLVDGNLLVQGDQGQLVLVKASPEGYSELARAHPLAGKCWTMPVVAGGKAFCRSDKEGICLDVSAR